jgi:putative hydrolase of the HAD superfamily
MINPRPELILFDAVGTLIFPDPPVLTAYQSVGVSFGDHSSTIELGARWGWAITNARFFRQLEVDGQTSEAAEEEFWRAIVAEVLEGVPPQHKEAAFQRLWQHFAEPNHWRLFDDVAETFAELRRRGYRLGIASNFDARLLGICRALPPLDTCADIFVSSQVGWCKPADGFYVAVQRATQIAPHQILMVGDSFDCDYEAPRKHGWQARMLVRDSGKRAANQLRRLTDLLPQLP